MGDFGNVRVDHYGHVQESFKDNIANLVGLGAYSIMGRGIVVSHNVNTPLQ